MNTTFQHYVVTFKDPIKLDRMFGLCSMYSMPYGGNSYEDAKDWAAYYQSQNPEGCYFVQTVFDSYSMLKK